MDNRRQYALYATNVDYEFIDSLERGSEEQQLEGSVPSSNSGVTFGAGIDIGVRSVQDLYRLGLSNALVRKLGPYCGKRGRAAKKAKRLNPVKLTVHQLGRLERAVKEDLLRNLLLEFHLTPGSDFREFEVRAQTVLASVQYQYGSLNRTPKFFLYAKRGDVLAMYNELRNFNDKFPTRRNQRGGLSGASAQWI